MTSSDDRPIGVLPSWFSTSVHGDLDCVDCHSHPGDFDDEPHWQKYIAVDCAECHEDEVDVYFKDPHYLGLLKGNKDVPTCAGCHAIDANPHRIQVAADFDIVSKCRQCHDNVPAEFVGSVHEDEFADEGMTCTTCHVYHPDAGPLSIAAMGCGSCHDDIWEEYDHSIHRKGRIGFRAGANCVDCHGGHKVLSPFDMDSPTHPVNIPVLCATCHSDSTVVTEDYVRLPVSAPNYLQSVHGRGWMEGKKTAICTDCHGSHDVRIAIDPESSVYRVNIAATCGKCHEEISDKYTRSVHGRAVELGLLDAPTCTDCHDEHLIQPTTDSRVRAAARARETCGNCHTNPEMIARYGLPAGVVSTYLDSYHAWAADRGSDLAATCTDCHNVHEIRAEADPLSSVHKTNLVATCGKCHTDSNERFAHSYTHASAQNPKGPHVWVRYIYLVLLAVVLGGMAIHNAVVARHELKHHFDARKHQPYVQRWQRGEQMQHLVLMVCFIGLGITGFALRFPDSWWVKLIGLGGNEWLRANLHRWLAVFLCGWFVYHVTWLIAARRGRWALGALAPGYKDGIQFFQNMAYNLGMRKERPHFEYFDYTQKAEYWALIWGTVVMALTGFILWFPTQATSMMPSWVVRVSEVVHFYEAILAVSAIVVWHLFYVSFLPHEYPVSSVLVNGRMAAHDWKEMHRAEYKRKGEGAIRYPDGAKEDIVTNAEAVEPNNGPNNKDQRKE